ncbi:MAG: cation:proton antiporter [Candidatus Saccharimonadales bacterium]
MAEFITFFIIIFAGLLFSEFFNRLHLPWVTALILSGIVFGTEGFNLIQSNEVTDFFSQIGLVFLMFMAGLAINFSTFQRVKREVGIVSLINGLAPLGMALLIASWFNLGTTAGLLLAAALVSSSIAVVLPSLEGRAILRRKAGQTILASTIVLDIVSVTFFSILIQQATDTQLPLLVLYVFLALALALLRIAVPRLESYLGRRDRQKFEQELQLIVGILLGTVVLFGLLGLHPAEAGFFAGLVLSDSVNSQVTRAKLHAIGYGIFIPVFFVMVGAEMQLEVFANNPTAVWLAAAVLIGSVTTKFFSGWLAGRLVKFTNRESWLLGAATIPQLNVTLAIAATGFAYGLINEELLAAMIILTIGTTLVAPPLMNRLAAREEAEYVESAA